MKHSRPKGERGAAAATGEPSKTLLVGLALANADVARSQTLERRQPRDVNLS